jgi:hypothetical protein
MSNRLPAPWVHDPRRQWHRDPNRLAYRCGGSARMILERMSLASRFTFQGSNRPVRHLSEQNHTDRPAARSNGRPARRAWRSRVDASCEPQYLVSILGARPNHWRGLKREPGARAVTARIPGLPRSGNWERTAHTALGSQAWEAAPSRSALAEAHEPEDLPRIARLKARTGCRALVGKGWRMFASLRSQAVTYSVVRIPPSKTRFRSRERRPS